MPYSLKNNVELRRAGNNERFVAFSFAAAELVVEIDLSGTITYAAGAFRSRLNRTPEDCVGHSVTELVAPVDQDALDGALMMLRERGRLLPWMLRLANRSRTSVAMAGLRLAPEGQPPRLCLTFALPPASAGSANQATPCHQLARAAEGRLGGAAPGSISLLEVTRGGHLLTEAEMMTPILEEMAPSALSSEVGPGRYGMLDAADTDTDLMAMARTLEATLRSQGLQVDVASHQIKLDTGGLTRAQASRALRQGLSVFARNGLGAVGAAGFGNGLAGYVEKAMTQASAVRRSIASRQFELLYQPIVDLSSRAVHHYEALLRPGTGAPMQTPQDYVVLVETVGLSDELDMAVAEMACSAAARTEKSIAFNLSGQSVQDPGFRTQLLPMLQANPAVRQGRMLVEMTETAQVEDVEQAAETARGLREMGVPFCLDDFGAGTADVRMLRAIPTDIVKLDGSFVHGIIGEGRERAFVAGMVEIARACGAAVVAEQVETEEEAAALSAIGAQYGQGWLYGRPAALPGKEPEPAAPVRPAKRKGVSAPVWG